MNAQTPNAAQQPNSFRLITPQAILSYPHLFAPHAGPGGDKPLYSATLIFPAGTDLTEMWAAVYAAARAKWGAQADAMLQNGQLKQPFRRGEEKGYPAGSLFFNARSQEKPGLVDRYAGPDGKPMPIVDPSLIYPGALVRCSVSFFAFANRASGVAVGLNNIQKLGDGPRLDNRKAASEEFDATETAPAPLEAPGQAWPQPGQAQPPRNIDDVLGRGAPQAPMQQPPAGYGPPAQPQAPMQQPPAGYAAPQPSNVQPFPGNMPFPPRR